MVAEEKVCARETTDSSTEDSDVLAAVVVRAVQLGPDFIQ
jgi:hypothetical protein